MKFIAAAKARGTKLGNLSGAAALRRAGKGNTAGVKAIKQAADDHAKDLAPVIESIRSEGIIMPWRNRKYPQRARYVDASRWAVAQVFSEKPIVSP